jgi:catechol 2,3-dioxygenase
MDFKIRRAGHVVLRVTDVARAKAFLEDVIGFTTYVQSGERFFFLSAQPVSNHHMIAVRSGKEGERLPDADNQIGMVSISYEVTDFEELARIYTRIKALGGNYGAKIVAAEDRGHINTVVCDDADGNRIEFYCYLSEDETGDTTPYVSRGSVENKLEAAASDTAPDMKAKVRRTSHLTLRSKDLSASRAFYEGVLDLFSIGEDGRVRVYLAGNPDTRIPVLALEPAVHDDGPEPTPKKMYGMEHFAMEVGSLDQLKAVYRSFKDAGIDIDHTVDHGITNSVYFIDPDGNLIEVYHDVPRAEYPEPEYPFASYGPIHEMLEEVD